MISSKNLYELLGVQFDAEDVVIVGAYKALIKKYHPDVWKGSTKVAEEKLKQLNLAYETLKDKSKRKAYDESLGLGPRADNKNTNKSEDQKSSNGESKNNSKKSGANNSKQDSRKNFYEKKESYQNSWTNVKKEQTAVTEDIIYFLPRGLTLYFVNFVYRTKSFLTFYNYLLLFFNLLTFGGYIWFVYDKPNYPFTLYCLTGLTLTILYFGFIQSLLNEISGCKKNLLNRLISNFEKIGYFREIFFLATVMLNPIHIIFQLSFGDESIWVEIFLWSFATIIGIGFFGISTGLRNNNSVAKYQINYWHIVAMVPISTIPILMQWGTNFWFSSLVAINYFCLLYILFKNLEKGIEKKYSSYHFFIFVLPVSFIGVGLLVDLYFNNLQTFYNIEKIFP